MLNNFLFLLLLVGCSSTQDPLKNSKKLIKSGHATLYNNGAFQVPSTKIKLIPSGPEPLTLAKELTGVRAKESFLRYLGEVKDSVVVVWEGGKKTYKFSQRVDKEVDESLSLAGKKMKSESVLILHKSFSETQNIIGKSFESAKRDSQNVKRIAKNFKKNMYSKYKVILPKLLNTNVSGESLDNFSKNFEGLENLRKKASKESLYLLGDSFRTYDEDISRSFSRARNEIENSDRQYGPTLAIVKSLYWVLDGILMEGIISPIGKFSAGAMGYTLVNGIAYPMIFLTKHGATSAKFAVEVLHDVSANTYEVLAPTLEIGLSAILTGTRKATGLVVGSALEYLASPLVYGTEVVAGGIGGVAVGVTGTTLAGAGRVGGEILGITSKTLAKTAQGATLALGGSFYVIKGSAEFAYEVTMSAAVPSSMILGSGLALSYGTVSQLGAQSVLAAADAAYLVLSMEGPSWVVYAVSGKLGDDPDENTIVDLEEMKKAGEEIRKVPVSSEELQKVLKSLNQ